MKNLILSLLLISAFSIDAKANGTIDSGLYKVTLKGDVYYYRFHHDSMLTITHGNDTSYAIYKTDTTKSPMHFDLKMYDVQGNYLYTSPCIYEKLGRNKIRLMFFPMVNYVVTRSPEAPRVVSR